jgi:hypothetical protein
VYSESEASLAFATRATIRDIDDEGKPKKDIVVQLPDADFGCLGTESGDDTGCGPRRDPAALYCLTPDRAWEQKQPPLPPTGDGEFPDPTEPCAVTTTPPGVVMMAADQPTDTDSDTQWVLFKNNAGTWHHGLQFCSRDDACANTFNLMTVRQRPRMGISG